ncbi:MAG: NAD(P)-dependent oxidoreductase [Cyanobacteria bacterium P01_D01_bin.116]
MEKPKIVIAQPVAADVEAQLQAIGEVVANPGPEPLTDAALRGACADADALVAFMTERVDDALLAVCPRLRIVAGALKGFDNIDVEACGRRGVAVTIVPDLLTEPTAELTLGLMIALCRNMRAGEAHLRSGRFAGWRPRFYGGAINGATVGVIGAGRVGCAILRLLNGFRCERLYYDARRLEPELEAALDAAPVGLDALATRSDFVVLALPLTSATLGLVDAGFLSRMKPGAYLINPARGSLVDEAAVVDALAPGRLGGYAADVFEMEDWARADRPAKIHPALLNSEKTILTPHIGSAVADVRRAIEQSAADSVAAMLRGEIPTTAINADALRQRGGQ